MKAETNLTAELEPMGIVIAHGPHVETAPTFAAYYWEPAPELPEEPSASKAA